jgi:adenine-specific DNA methylase
MKRKTSTLDQPQLPGVDIQRQPDLRFSADPKNTIELEAEPYNLGKAVKVSVPDFSDPRRPKTCLEVDFPIVPINALSRLEGNAGKPIYQMSKWWARRRSSVFRAMLLAAAIEAPVKKHEDGSPILDSDGIPIPDETEAAKAVWDVYYANHQKAENFKGLKVLDCFMGGGTTLVEGSRLGFQVSGADLNPVAWFVVKNELACTDPEDVRKFLEQIEAEVKPAIQPYYATECPRGHVGRWFRTASHDTEASDQQMPAAFDPLALSLEERKPYYYKGPEVIYTFWAKHGPCSKPGCGHRTPIFRTPVIAEKKLGVKYLDLTCKSCKTGFHAELGAARMAPSAERVVLSNEFPFTELSQPFAQRLMDYAKGTASECLERAKELAAMVGSEEGLKCPNCGTFAGEFLRDILSMHSAATRRSQIDKKHLNILPSRNSVKPVFTYLLIDPDWLKGAPGVWDGKSLGGYSDAPLDVSETWFRSRLNHLQFIEVRGQIKLAEDTSSQATDFDEEVELSSSEEGSTLDIVEVDSDQSDRKKYGLPKFITTVSGRVIDTRKGTVVQKATVQCQYCGNSDSIIEALRKAQHPAPLMPYALQCLCPECKEEGQIYDGRFFAPPSPQDISKLLASMSTWESLKLSDLRAFWPKQEIPYGWQTHYWSIPDHGYTHWYRMFNPRQLLVHATLLKTIMQSTNVSLPIREQTLGVFQQYLRNQCMFCIYDLGYDKLVPFFSNNNYVAKQLVLENSVFPKLGRGNWESCAKNVVEGLDWCKNPWEPFFDRDSTKSLKVFTKDPVVSESSTIQCRSSSDLPLIGSESIDLVITDPPFGDNFIYSEMANFFYAWLRIPLSEWYEQFKGIKDSPNAQEAVKNVAHHAEDGDEFYQSMMTACWSEAFRVLKPAGLMAFTFHHSEPAQWAIVLEALMASGFYIEAIYPVTSDESKGENAEFGSKKIEYDMLHVCRKRLTEPTTVSWAKMRQWVKAELTRLRLLLASYRANEISDADVRVILRGKALEFFSRHYGRVLTAADEPMKIAVALAGIDQLLDEGTGGAERPPSLVQPLAYQFLRLFSVRPSYSSDEVTKSLFGTAIRPKDLADRGWVEERNRVMTAISIDDRFEHHRRRPRKEMKTEVDQAHFLIGAAMPNSGINLEEELTKDTWMLRKSVDAVLDWYEKVTPDPTVRNAAMLAKTILRSSVARLRERPGALEEQLSLFNDWDDSES